MDQKELLTQSLIDEGYLKTQRIIDAFRAINRADFVLPENRDEAYGNYPLSIGHSQTISQPLTVAFMLELLDPQPGEKILDIGSGSGWQTALLAHIAAHIAGSDPARAGGVVAVERIQPLCDFAKKNLEKYGFITPTTFLQKGGEVKSERVTFYCLDATTEIPGGNYDKIIAAAAAIKDIPRAWREKLKVGGKIVAPVDDSVWLYTKKSNTEWEEREFPGFAFVPLIVDEKLKTKDQRSKTQTKKRKNLNLFGYLFFIFGFLFLILAASVYEIYMPRSLPKESQSIEIPSGAGSRQIGTILKERGVIRSKWLFVTYVSLRGDARSLKPGRYTWYSVSTHSIARDLTAGGAFERVITIPEGWSIKDIAQYLERQELTENENFIMAANPHYRGLASIVSGFDFLEDKPIDADLEGYLFPDTYRIFTNATSEDIIIKMLDNFDGKLTPELRTEIAQQGKTIFEIVTMASLIEKEVVTEEDRALVSGVLWKRLGTGIPLQVDATITYITGKRSTKVSREETQIYSPYNTYKYAGLPKGPIANPGTSAIRAAIYPKTSPYLYYLSTPEGETIFSRTLEEHNEAKAKYLKQ